MTEGIELTDLLDPYLFTNHRDVVNALFEVYYDIGELYLEKLYDPLQSNEIKSQAKQNIERKLKLGTYFTKY